MNGVDSIAETIRKTMVGLAPREPERAFWESLRARAGI